MLLKFEIVDETWWIFFLLRHCTGAVVVDAAKWGTFFILRPDTRGIDIGIAGGVGGTSEAVGTITGF